MQILSTSGRMLWVLQGASDQPPLRAALDAKQLFALHDEVHNPDVARTVLDRARGVLQH